MAAVNVSKNRLELLSAYQDVITETSPTDWALYTYEDSSNDLTLASSGGGGLVEIAGVLDSARVMYGFCSLKEPGATLPRYVLINWVGEDVADARKCQCASHVAAIAEFFQVSLTEGVDVVINASTLDDIEPSAILQRLTNGTASLASPALSRLRIRDEEHADVGTVYTKTNAEIEMKKINREEFWEQAKRDEELRKEEERGKAAEERRRFEEERRQLERREEEEREERYREREREIEEHRKKMQEEEEAKDRTHHQPPITAEPSLEDPFLEKKESEVEEAKAIIAARADNPREFFKRREKPSPETSPPNTHRRGRLDSPFLKQPSSPGPAPPPPHPRPDGDPEESSGRSMAPSPPHVPLIVFQEEEEPEAEPEEWGVETQRQRGPVQESTTPPTPTPAKPVQSVAPQTRDPPLSSSVTRDDDRFSAAFREETSAATAATTDGLADLWGGGPSTGPASQVTDSSESRPHRPAPLMSFEGEAGGERGEAGEDQPSSLVDLDGPHQMTLSYQHALQHAGSAPDSRQADDGQLLLTNGEASLKEGTQVSEGYFSQSQEEEFAQSEDCSAKVTPTPVFYNKPPEIDITCWDTDPVEEDD